MNSAGNHYAGFWRRFGAACIDILLAAAVTICGLLIWSSLTHHAQAWDAPMTATALALVASVAFLLGLWLDAKLQGTPGKHLLGCRVQDAATGNNISIKQSLGRGLAMLLSALPAGLGFLWIAWGKNRQGFHDRLSGSVVVIEDEAHTSLAELAGNLK